VTVERADTLQVATSGAMWQFRLHQGSVFRLHAAAARRVTERRGLPARGPSPRLRRILPSEPAP
jgi:hypothetical protein